MMRLLISLLFLFTISLTKKLMFVQVTSRHGARYPSYPNQIDYSNITLIRGTRNELTTQGKLMHYKLGKLLFQKYWIKLFKDTPF